MKVEYRPFVIGQWTGSNKRFKKKKKILVGVARSRVAEPGIFPGRNLLSVVFPKKEIPSNIWDYFFFSWENKFFSKTSTLYGKF